VIAVDPILPIALAGAGTATLVVGALVAAAALIVARRQIGIRWHRVFGEPADASRAKGDLGEALAYATARQVAADSPELDLRIFPGRRVRETEIDLVIVARSAVWVVECKAWGGRLVAGADRWISWSTPKRGAPVQHRRRDPVRQAQVQARSLARHLAEGGLTAIPVRELVVFTRHDVDLDGVREAGFVLYLDELPGFFEVGLGGEGVRLPDEAREQACRLLQRTPSWDFLELEGGGRRGRITTDALTVVVDGERRVVALGDVREASFRLRGWPRQRLRTSLRLDDSTLKGWAADPVARLWLKEGDGKVHPYPLCLLRGFVRGHEGPQSRR
jgi:hypothetical protein